MSSNKIITQILRLSEVTKPTGEPCISLKRLRRYLQEYRIDARTFESYVHSYRGGVFIDNSKEIKSVVQTIYDATVDENQYLKLTLV